MRDVVAMLNSPDTSHPCQHRRNEMEDLEPLEDLLINTHHAACGNQDIGAVADEYSRSVQ